MKNIITIILMISTVAIAEDRFTVVDNSREQNGIYTGQINDTPRIDLGRRDEFRAWREAGYQAPSMYPALHDGYSGLWVPLTGTIANARGVLKAKDDGRRQAQKRLDSLVESLGKSNVVQAMKDRWQVAANTNRTQAVRINAMAEYLEINWRYIAAESEREALKIKRAQDPDEP